MAFNRSSLMLLAVLVSGSGAVWSASFPVEVTELLECQSVWIAPGDVDGDSTDELISIENDYAIQPRTQSGSAATQTWTFSRGTFDQRPRAGAAGDGCIWVTATRRDSLVVFDLARDRARLVVSGIDIRDPKGWDGYVSHSALVDLKGDGSLKLVLAVAAGPDPRPRGVFVIDWASGRQEWSFLCAGPIAAWEIDDFDHDGRMEILCGTSAPSNGNEDNGMADWLSYVLLLGADGTERWRRQIGHYSSAVWAIRLVPRSGAAPVVFAGEFGVPPGERQRDSVFLLDPRNGDVLRRGTLGGFNKGYARLTARSGRQRVCAAGEDDTLRLLDEQLRVVRRAKGGAAGLDAICSGDFTGRGQSEAAMVSGTGQLSLYDPELRLLSRTYVGATSDLQAVRYKGRSRLLCGTAYQQDVSIWRLREFTVVPLLGRTVALPLVLGGGTFLLLAFALTFVYLRYQRTRDIRSVVRSLTGQAGTVELNRKGVVTSTNQRAREVFAAYRTRNTIDSGPAGAEKRMTQIPSVGTLAPVAELARAMLAEPEKTAPREIVISPAPGKTNLVRCVRVKTGAVLTIEDISAVEYLQRVKSWAPVAQKLAHGIKNPLNTILGSVEQIELKCEDDKVKKYMGYVKDEVARLRKMTDAFMRFTKLNPPALEPKDVNEVVRKVVTKFESLLADGFNHESTKDTKEESGARSQPPRHQDTNKELGSGLQPRKHEGTKEAGGAGFGGIELRLELDDKLPLVPLDEVGLSSALEILVENAIEAMTEPAHSIQHTENRVLIIRTSLGIRGQPETREIAGTAPNSRAEDSASSAPSAVSSAGSFVRIEVVDTGRGIPEKYLEKVFEPYFTHGKETGTGLGLALAKKIVEDHKGRIEIESHEGTGTTVRIILPVKA